MYRRYGEEDSESSDSSGQHEQKDRRLSADDYLSSILGGREEGRTQSGKARKRSGSSSSGGGQWRPAEIRQPVFIRYLEAETDEEERDKIKKPQKEPVSLYQGLDTLGHLPPIVYRELFKDQVPESEDIVQPLHVHLEKVSYNKDVKIPEVRPIVIERWIRKHPSKDQQREEQKRKEEGMLTVKEHPRDYKIVPDYINLGTKKVNVKEYMDRITQNQGEIIIESDGIFMRTCEDFEETLKEQTLEQQSDLFKEQDWNMTNVDQAQATKL